MAAKSTGLHTGVSDPAAVEAFLKKLKHPMHKEVASLRTLILSIDKHIGEGVFWNAPVFYFTGKMKPFEPKSYKRYIVGFNLFKKDCIRLIFLRGASVTDPNGMLEGDYKDGRRLALIHDSQDVKRRTKALKAIIKQLLKSVDD